MMNNYLYGNEERLFLNTNLGCSAKCSYCYLTDLNFETGKKPENIIDIDILLEMLNLNKNFKKGKYGTILSLGCYSECWDKYNRKDTINLINKLLKYDNPIQLATKEYVNEDDFAKINYHNIKYKNHLSIYISSSTISNYKKYEKGTTNPISRFKSFKLKNKYDIPMYLYIKPVLKEITIKDLNQYIEIIKQYNINAIVGELFTIDGEQLAPISNGKLHYANYNNENDIITNELSKYCNIYNYSIEPIKQGINDG